MALSEPKSMWPLPGFPMAYSHMALSEPVKAINSS
jgi:hypothetical protein